VEGYDEAVFDLRPDYQERTRQDLRELIARLEGALAAESDPRVRQDLEILIDAERDQIRSSELNQRLMLPYFNLGQAIFFGVQSLLDPQIAPERRQPSSRACAGTRVSSPATSPS
jgi:hypothetical protein